MSFPPFPPLPSTEAVVQAVNAIRFLALDATAKAKSGHPGAPMGMAEMAFALWQRLQHNPADPLFANRDRVVLSNGHASMLLYSLLHLSGYSLSLNEIRRFRQIGSQTPGHPEHGLTPGVETTTGPLGQGFANAVGMALAEKLLAAEFNRDGFAVVNHFTYCFVGDGCLMEGISHEAASLAGVLRLGKLITLYDSNRISIDGDTANWFSDDTPARFKAYGWDVITVADGHNVGAVIAAIDKARSLAERPTLICCATVIGKGAAVGEGSADIHGSPLTPEAIDATREALGWNHPPFHIPDAVYRLWDAKERGATLQARWQNLFNEYRSHFPREADELERRLARHTPEGFDSQFAEALNVLGQKTKPLATRKSSQLVLESLAPLLPEMFGGSADLSGSNLTQWPGVQLIAPALQKAGVSGNYLSYGVREFGMAAIMNGMALHGGFIPFGGTFLVFSDYARNAIRLAALMRLPVIYVLTHDSIGLGEDGPTHQPVEHTPSLQLIPNLDVWRPADVMETAYAWRAAIDRAYSSSPGPTALVLSRQNLPPVSQGDNARRGGYVLDAPTEAKATLIANGSELALAREAAAVLALAGIPLRLVSMPSTAVFDREPLAYRREVLGGLPRFALEAAAPTLWWRYLASDGGVGVADTGSGQIGGVIGLYSFGESAPAPALFEHFGLTADKVAEFIRTRI